jgi:hypothetical protein
MASQGRRSKEVLTLVGKIIVERTYYVCRRPDCSGSGLLKDILLDIEGTSFSPGLRRLMARSGSKESFAEAAQDLWHYAGIRVLAKDVERVAEAIGADIARREKNLRREVFAGNPPGSLTQSQIPILYIAGDGTGVPMTRPETRGRRGKQPDGGAKTREAKLGCVFQVGTDAKGLPVRQEGSTTYTGAIETAEVFGERLYAEAAGRGLGQAQTVVVLGDGAHWIRNLAALHFPEAVHIVDLYHARQHLQALLQLLFPAGEFQDARGREWSAWLDEGNVEKIMAAAARLLPAEKEVKKTIHTEMEYFKTNVERMRYAAFRARSFFVGSGVVEAGCKTLIARRMKKSGAKWSLRGANSIIELRCCLASSRFEDYWARRSRICAAG